MQNLIVLAVLAIAAFYILIIIYRGLKKDPDCGCVCSTCELFDKCDEPQKSEESLEKENSKAGRDNI